MFSCTEFDDGTYLFGMVGLWRAGWAKFWFPPFEFALGSAFYAMTYTVHRSSGYNLLGNEQTPIYFALGSIKALLFGLFASPSSTSMFTRASWGKSKPREIRQVTELGNSYPGSWLRICRSILAVSGLNLIWCCICGSMVWHSLDAIY